MALPANHIDTLEAVRELEKSGIPHAQAEAQIRVYLKVINMTIEDRLISKQELAENTLYLVKLMTHTEERLTSEIQAVDKKLSDQISAVDKKLSDQIIAVDKKLSDQIIAVDKKLSDQIIAVDKKLSDQIITLDKKIDAVEKNLNEKIGAVEKNLTEQMHTLDKRLTQEIHALDKKIDALAYTVSNLSTTLVRKLGLIAIAGIGALAVLIKL